MEVLQSLSDNQIINALRSGDKMEEERVFLDLFDRFYGLIESLVVNKGGTKDDAKEVFWAGATALWHNIQKKDFELSATLKTYFYKICEYKWFEELRKRKRQSDRTTEVKEVHHQFPAKDNIEEGLFSKERNQWLWNKIEQLSEKCIALLTMFHIEGQSMKEITQKTDFPNEKATKSSVYRCRQKLIDLVLKDPNFPR